MIEENYSFDEQTKRLKPVSKTCFYCNCNKDSNTDSDFYVKLYKEQKRANYLIYRNVQYSSFEIGLPRCISCKSIHDKVEKYSKFIFVGFLVMLTIVGLCYSEMPKNLVILILLTDFFAFIFYIAGNSSFKYFLPIKSLEKNLIKKYKILTTRQSIKNSKRIEEFLKNGWALDQPTP